MQENTTPDHDIRIDDDTNSRQSECEDESGIPLRRLPEGIGGFRHTLILEK